MRSLFLFIIFSSLIACVKVEPSKELPNYSVYSILNPSDSLINVFVGRTFKTNEFFSIDSGKAVLDARVEIRSRDTFRSIIYNEKSKSYQANNEGFLKAGEEYYLTIEVNDEVLEGFTIIPEETTLILDQAEVVQELEGQVLLSWQKTSLNNGIYRLEGSVDLRSNVFSSFFWGQKRGIWETSDIMNDSEIISSPLGSFNFTASSNEAYVNIELFTLDDNYSDFLGKENIYQLRSDFSRLFESPVIFNSNVSNSMGIFGSYVVSEVNFKMTK